ncbi:bifunctional aminoglycoside phosphotransferase/ATP-binding protein [Rubripirellula reticaptiva]|uniref:Zeta toxin n=1 Tax=Rubripirellula reticaptiva TaxID=2528013 RepID=A0A5C6ECP8_9BACT|nr:bifunctional aminoglycoside phosphotransferase/ATP-binding protein [Rubripirellula reticaptiva]TWU46688.1 Zeta toxin [Rubripirellula reticaptiva]
MSAPTEKAIRTETLVEGLSKPGAYPHPVEGIIEVQETHISIVFLAGEFAYKIKKSIKTNFLDYSTLELRRHFCHEEVRLDGRYENDLYLGVVPICLHEGHIQVDGSGERVEYAVKMRRFKQGSLLSEQIKNGKLTTAEVHQLADNIASFHKVAAISDTTDRNTWPDFFVKNLHQIVLSLQSKLDRETVATLKAIHRWTDDWLKQNFATLAKRLDDGFVRECHGDLHLGNVVHWGDRLVPFDGVEFNEELRWIDILADAAFLQMDLAFCGHLDLSRTFMNHYLEGTGDYDSLDLIRPFLIYRSLVRALVATIRTDQSHLKPSDRESAMRDARKHVQLAHQFTAEERAQLWITHGVSGSGKTTLSELVVQRHDAVRLRSDTERKRIFGLLATDRPSSEQKTELYSEASSEKTYAYLEDRASQILRAGYSVIIDATFLRQRDRERFHELATSEGVPFAILDCHSDEQTLRQRVADRMSQNQDASDADLRVLEHQLATHQPLTQSELSHVVDVPDLVQVAAHL